MKRKMFQKVMAAVLCAGLAVPTAVQPLTVTAFADDTVAESVAESDATEEAASDESVADEAAADQTNEAAESTETEDQTSANSETVTEQGAATSSDASQEEAASDGATSVVVGDADSTASTDSGTELIRGKTECAFYSAEGKSFYAELVDALIPDDEDVYFAIWSSRDGQDDLHWYKANNILEEETNPNLKFYSSDHISIHEFRQKVDGLYDGVWNIHAYVKKQDGTMEFLTSSQFTIEKKNEYNMYRLYNPNSGEHFFTQNADERDHLVSVGWRYEGVAWKAPEEGEPVYRLYNPNAGDHHYTMDEDERDMLVTKGWKYEGVAWLSDNIWGTEIYRVYNPNNGGKAGAHFYTARRTEKDYLVSLGWRYEDVGWYGASEDGYDD